VRASYLSVCDTVGRDVRVHLPDGSDLTGRASDIDPDGRLVVDSEAAGRVVLGAGDVVHVRPRG
jgi:BirA family biotin operon repressor/biotin-[acetyl-CoA-carboxylase] ligase